jgi:hypothetical protein
MNPTFDQIFREFAPALYRESTYLCEHGDHRKNVSATFEVRGLDEDNSTYSTYVCGDHLLEAMDDFSTIFDIKVEAIHV